MLFGMGLLFLGAPVAHGADNSEIVVLDKYGKPVTQKAAKPLKVPAMETLTEINVEEIVPEDEDGHGVLFNDPRGNLSVSHFTWGAEVGSSIDVTGHDMSTFDADVHIGYKNSYIKLIGVGAGIHRSIHMGHNFIPVYGVIRTSFRKQPSLLFLNLQGGYSFNKISHHDTMGDFFASLGIGINLSQKKRAKSYIIASCGYQRFNQEHRELIGLDTGNIYFAKLLIGVSF